MATFTITYTPGYVWAPGDIVTIAKLNLAANPTLQLLGTISSTSIADGAITPAKLNVSVAGPGMTGGGGTALSPATDGTLAIVANLLTLAAASVSLDKTRIGSFIGASAFAEGIHGFVPAPRAGQQGLYLDGSGAWSDPLKAFSLRNSGEIFKAFNFN